MRSGKELKKSLESSLWNKIIALLLVVTIIVPCTAYAEPLINDVPLPPASFTRIDDHDLLIKIGLDPGPAYCYDVHANSVIITAPARERAKCELKLMYELEKQKTIYELQISKLQLRVETLERQHRSILEIKDQEINRLSDAAMKRPNDYNVWWGVGGFVVGSVTTVLVGWLVVSAQSGFSN